MSFKRGEKNGILKLFYMSVRGLNVPRLYEYLSESAKESIIDTFLLVFHIRDCREGKGEKYLGRKSLVWLFLNYPDEFSKIFKHISEYGRWDDFLYFFPNILELNNIEYITNNYKSNISGEIHLNKLRKLQDNIVKYLSKQLLKDKKNMEKGEEVSFCAKWMPTERCSIDREYNLVKILCKKMKVSKKEYRKFYISPLRSYLNIVEKMICENRWNEINYSNVPF